MSYLKQNRTSDTKPFSIHKDQLVGDSKIQQYENSADYRDVKGMYDSCLQYANSYTKIMLNRAAVEDPEIFAVKGISREEMH